MNTILDKVKIYLDKVSNNPVAISEDLVEEFGEACKSALRRQFSEKRRDSFEPRMSNIGRPLCQLQMESKGIKGDGQPYNNKMRNTFGDLIEALAIFVLKSAGVKIDSEQKEVKYKFKEDSMSGRLDVEIDNKIWDIKSASPYSFEHKFGEKGGFNEVVNNDSFGYASQGFLYAEGMGKPFGGWIAINKSTGEWTVCEAPDFQDEHKNKYIKIAADNYTALKNKTEFQKCFDDIAETFRGKPTGNRTLGTVCSFCPYKVPCWGDGLQHLPQQQSKGKNPKWVWYTSVTNPKKDDMESNGE
jgi:hypothetical protein